MIAQSLRDHRGSALSGTSPACYRVASLPFLASSEKQYKVQESQLTVPRARETIISLEMFVKEGQPEDNGNNCSHSEGDVSSWRGDNNNYSPERGRRGKTQERPASEEGSCPNLLSKGEIGELVSILHTEAAI